MRQRFGAGVRATPEGVAAQSWVVVATGRRPERLASQGTQGLQHTDRDGNHHSACGKSLSIRVDFHTV